MKNTHHFTTNITLISQCQMFTAGLKHLITGNVSVCHVTGAPGTLFLSEKTWDKKVDLMIFSLSTQSVDVEQCIQFLGRIRKHHPNLMIVVAIEDCMAYLIASLRFLNVNTIISQKAMLNEWRELINLALKRQGGYCQLVNRAMDMAPEVNSLKRKELIILDHVANGMPLKNVADLMSRGVKTITAKKLNAMRKLGINNYAELIALKSIIANANSKLAEKS
ncbi:Transcriptional activator protein BglJ [Serratia fonticola]|nr:LuxR C-terminal-related transcriptional regulator [Serratia fonticola]CAI1646880.1 Transcriptional activator protein BglJ [Serratia fonticola]CAI1708524.1 Transcriptional activator protein BglJ [Serratia fonticola]CAI1886398.1 Transcriptional activator protein BglJ [Serratia fonticola]